MSYIRERNSRFGGGVEWYIDLPAFAADLAKALGGTRQPDKDYPEERQSILIGQSALSLSATRYVARDKHRVHVSIRATDVPWEDRDTYAPTHRTPSASVSPDARPIAQIATDIHRRVIAPAQEALRLQREHAAKQARNRASIVELAVQLKEACPTLSVRVDERAQSASIYGDDPYISATMRADGTVHIERMASLSLDKFRALCALLCS